VHSVYPFIEPTISAGRLSFKFAATEKNMSLQRRPDDISRSGFSVIELLVVLGVIALLSVISLPYIVNFTKPYKSEDQSLKVMDLMRETAQLALTRRRTVRFEIDLTDNAVNIIDENGSDPDRLVKSVPLEATKDVRIDVIPAGVTRPNPPNYANATYTPDSLGHLRGSTTVSGNTVFAVRFRSDGSAVSATNVPLNRTMFVWPPLTPGSTTPRSNREVRAITLFGGSGAIRYWKHNGSTFVAANQ